MLHHTCTVSVLPNLRDSFLPLGSWNRTAETAGAASGSGMASKAVFSLRMVSCWVSWRDISCAASSSSRCLFSSSSASRRSSSSRCRIVAKRSASAASRYSRSCWARSWAACSLLWVNEYDDIMRKWKHRLVCRNGLHTPKMKMSFVPSLLLKLVLIDNTVEGVDTVLNPLQKHVLLHISLNAIRNLHAATRLAH